MGPPSWTLSHIAATTELSSMRWRDGTRSCVTKRVQTYRNNVYFVVQSVWPFLYSICHVPEHALKLAGGDEIVNHSTFDSLLGWNFVYDVFELLQPGVHCRGLVNCEPRAEDRMFHGWRVGIFLSQFRIRPWTRHHRCKRFANGCYGCCAYQETCVGNGRGRSMCLAHC